MINSMSFRQVHLDFHTSEHIKNIGSKFKKSQFQEMLRLGNIGSITVFSKCHHGMTYHPTKIGCQHPYLKFNLLSEQIAACHEIGVKAPIYISAGFDEYYRQRNPGDMLVSSSGNNPFEICFKRLCFNTRYLDFLCAQIEEVVDTFDCDGIFLDIVGAAPCVCMACQRSMFDRGLDPSKPTDVNAFAEYVSNVYYKRTLAAVRKNDPKMRIFQNSGHIHKGQRDFFKFVSHLELESLPTGGWGYDHFPSSAKYAAVSGMDFLGMTGKFHTTWGEFGGFKHPNALRYETSAMLAFGAKCSVGDQLHPNGKMNEDTYNIIGQAYSEVEKKEPFCINATSVAEVALLSIESLGQSKNPNGPQLDRTSLADTGALRMLLERKVIFDVIDSEMDFNNYKVLIVPDENRMTDKVACKINKFLSKGGKLMISYEAALRPENNEFYFNLGKYVGKSGYSPEYLSVRNSLFSLKPAGRLIKSPFVIYGDSVDIETDAQVYADKLLPVFNRTLAHFSSHQHAPDGKKSQYPAVIMKENICYFAHAIFTAYANNGQMLYRELFFTMLDHLLDGVMAETSLQSAGRINLMEQKHANRYILHLLYASPIKRGGNAIPVWNIRDIEVIEDIVKIADVKCSLKLPKKIKSVKEALTGREISFTQTGGRIEFTVPELECHQLIQLCY